MAAATGRGSTVPESTVFMSFKFRVTVRVTTGQPGRARRSQFPGHASDSELQAREAVSGLRLSLTVRRWQSRRSESLHRADVKVTAPC